MISLAEINNIANKFQVSAETIEKDYVISWILLCLAQSKLKEDFIFYGGTAIKRIYFEDHRFSEDIDLISPNSIAHDDLLKQLSCLNYAREMANLNLEINQANIIAARDRIQLYVQYSGYDEIIGTPKEIRLDFSMAMQLFGTTENKKIIASYSDLHQDDNKLTTMGLNTILANKIGLIMDSTRNEPRDLYDIWFLLRRVSQFDFNFEEVRKTIKEKYSFFPSFNILRPYLCKNSLKRNWETRLNKQVPHLVDIDVVISDVETALKNLFYTDNED